MFCLSKVRSALGCSAEVEVDVAAAREAAKATTTDPNNNDDGDKMAAAATSPARACSRRSQRDARSKNPCSGGCRWAANPYSEGNPRGIIKMGKAENKLCEDMIVERFSREDMQCAGDSLVKYHNLRGTSELRESVANFLYRKFHAAPGSIDGDDIFIINGCISAIQQFAYAVADEGDGILVPAPYYEGMLEHLRNQVNVRALPVHVEVEGRCAGPRTDQLHDAYLDAQRQGIRVRALFVINPHNPTGLLMTRQEIDHCLEFAHSHALHVCFDEIYALSVYRGAECDGFTSVLSLPHLLDPARTHFIYGLSKDFALPSLRVGIFHTRSPDLQEAFTVSSYYHNVPAVVQHQVCTMLRDQDWVDSYLAHNVDQMRTARYMLSEALDHLQIPYIDGCAGFFLWVDFSQLLYECSVEAEQQLFFHFLREGVFVNPGSVYCSS